MGRMNRLIRGLTRRSAVLAVIGAVGLTAASCSGSHHRSLAGSAGSGTIGAGAGGSSTSLGTQSTTSVPSGTGATTSTTARSGTAATGSHAAGAPPLNTNTSPSNGSSGAPAPATPGTYTIDQSGGISSTLFSQSEPPQGTLVVDPAQANGVQVEHRYVDQNNQPANTTTQFLPSGPVILSTTEGSGSTGVSCTFNPPIAAPPWPPAVGKTFSSQGDCGNGTTVTVQGKITGSQTATLKDGETFTVWVIDSTINMSGQITASGTQVDWYAPALRLPTHEQTDVQGKYNGVQFTLHSVSDLVSSHPS
jgi:hypothetical protein